MPEDLSYPYNESLLRRWASEGRVAQCPVCGSTLPDDWQWDEKRRREFPRCEKGHRRRAMKVVPLVEALDALR